MKPKFIPSTENMLHDETKLVQKTQQDLIMAFIMYEM